MDKPKYLGSAIANSGVMAIKSVCDPRMQMSNSTMPMGTKSVAADDGNAYLHLTVGVPFLDGVTDDYIKESLGVHKLNKVRSREQEWGENKKV